VQRCVETENGAAMAGLWTRRAPGQFRLHTALWGAMSLRSRAKECLHGPRLPYLYRMHVCVCRFLRHRGWWFVLGKNGCERLCALTAVVGCHDVDILVSSRQSDG